MKTKVYVDRPKECKGTFYATADTTIDDMLIYGYGNTAKAAIECLDGLVEEVNEYRQCEGKESVTLEKELVFDVPALFSYYSFLNVSEVAKRMGINSSLMRRYSSGECKASEKRMKQIEECIHSLAAELASAVIETEPSH